MKLGVKIGVSLGSLSKKKHYTQLCWHVFGKQRQKKYLHPNPPNDNRVSIKKKRASVLISKPISFLVEFLPCAQVAYNTVLRQFFLTSFIKLASFQKEKQTSYLHCDGKK
jgi:hypothetical protein